LARYCRIIEVFRLTHPKDITVLRLIGFKIDWMQMETILKTVKYLHLPFIPKEAFVVILNAQHLMRLTTSFQISSVNDTLPPLIPTTEDDVFDFWLCSHWLIKTGLCFRRHYCERLGDGNEGKSLINL